VNDKINNSRSALESYILKENFQGYDPFDGLNSPLFKLPILNKNRPIRFGYQQILRKLSLNIRPLLGIKKGLNPVTLGLSIQAFAYSSIRDKNHNYYDKINYCLNELIRLQSKECSGSCWGYDFDWEARYFRIKSYTPTIVATGIIINALYEYYKINKDDKVKDLILSSARFILKDLNRTYDKDGDYCFSYSPYDRQVVFNAAMKGARLLAQCYSINHKIELLEEAGKTVSFVMKNQSPDGAWPYSKGDARTWVDNFHTAYILDCLHEYIQLSNDKKHDQNIELGRNYYIKTFFKENGIACYYNNKTYPIDSTAAAQSVITLTRFGQNEMAEKVLLWMIENMQSPSGYFYYQKRNYYTNKISYMRWSNAWMLLAMNYYLYKCS
jgi:hypothetical protein